LSELRWRIRFGVEAENDFVRILDYTRGAFGVRQAEIYRPTLPEAIAALEDGPNAPGSVARDEILPGLRSLHVARRGRHGRHFIVYLALTDEARVIDILRILHDAMDLARHLPEPRE
jgi:toxin ParE1/3/4